VRDNLDHLDDLSVYKSIIYTIDMIMINILGTYKNFNLLHF